MGAISTWVGLSRAWPAPTGVRVCARRSAPWARFPRGLGFRGHGPLLQGFGHAPVGAGHARDNLCELLRYFGNTLAQRSCQLFFVLRQRVVCAAP
jgi:hypothetical protein